MSAAVATDQKRQRSEVHEELLEKQKVGRRKTAGTTWLLRVGVIAAFLALWQAAYTFSWMNPVFISDPVSVATRFYEYLTGGAIWVDVWATLKASLVGLVVGSFAGILSGLVLAEFETFRKAVNPIITLANALPRPALAPIFLVWFGLGMGSKVAVAVSIVYFLLLINTLAGVDGVDSDRLMLAKTLRMGRLQRFRYLQLPTAGPSIIAGLRLGAVYSVLGVVVAEMVASTDGLGLRLVMATNQFDIAGSFAIIFLLALMAFALDWIVGMIQQRLTWNADTA